MDASSSMYFNIFLCAKIPFKEAHHSWLWQFHGLPQWMTLTVLKSAGQVLHRVPLDWNLPQVFLKVVLGLERYFLHIVWRACSAGLIGHGWWWPCSPRWCHTCNWLYYTLTLFLSNSSPPLPEVTKDSSYLKSKATSIPDQDSVSTLIVCNSSPLLYWIGLYIIIDQKLLLCIPG